ncbi:helix-turn-helix transcriptional regulator [Paractinoplanes atraurantiacus]|uniref:Predicted ATPase n=1 Tax=Paractinoplanes atraurantiacus TaxID=1036182 RepID=A0A285JKY1_9ACTN|nr:LuxR C-terminal-related transcriptional regulator [Actinoplanes atraurantiacus]SNY60918.1 Predicted ATPase [Actinoplanes atraurantiacus]
MGSRADDAAAVLAAIGAATRGHSGTLLVSGEAGAGKTTLLRDACDTTAVRVIWAPCLPLSSLAMPLLPLRTGLRTIPDPPSLDAPDAVLAFDTWLDRLTEREPAALVVDDLQWADQSSLDVLHYVIAGRPNRRLAVLATLRTGEETRLHRWLADIRRLPGVRERALRRLDRPETHEQMTALLARPPHESLVDEVFARSAGNPYLTKLLIRGLDPDARHLPPHLPDELRGALARTWRDLPAPARELTMELATAGQPSRSGSFSLPALREAVDAGVLTATADGRYWFAHPLLAEVLADSLLPEERRARHAALAATAGDPIARADHYFEAGMTDEAYEWALTAADAAGGGAETIRLLRRALRLHADDSAHAEEILHRIREAAHAAGRAVDELEAIDELLEHVDRAARPLTAAELLARRTKRGPVAGRGLIVLADAAEAERLSAAHPRSREHALALATAAYARLWHAVDGAADRADEALRLARAGGWPDAITEALVAVSHARAVEGDLVAGAAAAREAFALAMSRGDFARAVEATYWIVNNTDGPSFRAVVDVLRECRQLLERAGAPHAQVSEVCSLEAQHLLIVGDWRGCVERLRVTLGARPSPLADARGRHTAALLACRQGRAAEAEAHARRAEELIADSAGFLPFPFDAVRAELAVTVGDTERALTYALHGLEMAPPPLDVDLLLPLAVRALADRAQACRDGGADPAAELDRLRDLRERCPAVVVDRGASAQFEARRIAAMQDLTEAETLRARRDPGEPAAWHRAAEACRTAIAPWDEAYCRWREAQTSLRGRVDRRRGTAALRRAHELALDLGAAPLLASIDLLARNAHVPLTVAAEPAAAGDTIPGLTAREREVLSHLVAGRTYAEIARALVLSEKTVSVHVSNMLRKTGTAGRAELAELAQRQENS